MMIEKIIVVAPDYRRSNQYRLGSCFKGIAGTIVFFQQVFGPPEVRVDVVVLFQFAADVRNLLNQRQFVDRLRIVRNRTIGVDSDRYRPHAEEAERY